MLIPPQYVKAYVARGKNDAADAAAICEAMSRPHIRQRLVPIKSAEQTAAQMMLGIREGLVRRRTQLANTIRGHAAEFGLVTAKGLDKVELLLTLIADDAAVSALAKEMFAVLGQEVESTMRYSKSGSSDIASNICRQTPSRLHRLNRWNTLFHSPNASGKSRHGEPVRTIHSTPSTNIRLSRPVEPFWSG